MTNEEVLIKLIEMRYVGLTVPTQAMVTATVIDLEGASIEGRSVQEVAIAILEQAFSEDASEASHMPHAFRPPPSSAGAAP